MLLRKTGPQHAWRAGVDHSPALEWTKTCRSCQHGCMVTAAQKQQGLKRVHQTEGDWGHFHQDCVCSTKNNSSMLLECLNMNHQVYSGLTLFSWCNYICKFRASGCSNTAKIIFRWETSICALSSGYSLLLLICQRQHGKCQHHQRSRHCCMVTYGLLTCRRMHWAPAYLTVSAAVRLSAFTFIFSQVVKTCPAI